MRRDAARIAALIAPPIAAALLPAGAQAEVSEESAGGFVTRHELVVEASPKETWLALISPARWWSSQHTWSGEAANLTLTPQAGGCFCETIPEVDEPDRFTLEGSVEHMRIIQSYPEQALRMVGALGPLQSEPVTGVLTIALTPLESGSGPLRTRIVWEYNVGGSMRFEIPVIAKAVDGVMGLQARGLGEHLGAHELVAGFGPDSEAPDEQSEAAGESEGEGEGESEGEAGAAAVIDPDSVLEMGVDEPAPASEPQPRVTPSVTPSVEDAFGDLSDSPPPGSRPGA